MVHAPSSLRLQNGPPGCPSKTWTCLSLRRISKRPALCILDEARRGIEGHPGSWRIVAFNGSTPRQDAHFSSIKGLPLRRFTQHVAPDHTVATQSENRRGFVALHESECKRHSSTAVSKPNGKWNSGHDLKDFNAHSGNAAISDSQRARRAK